MFSFSPLNTQSREGAKTLITEQFINNDLAILRLPGFALLIKIPSRRLTLLYFNGPFFAGIDYFKLCIALTG